jgi:hypothetical protein
MNGSVPSKGASSRRRMAVSALALVSLLASSITAQAQLLFPPFPTETNTYGDQLVYFYDVRPARTTFLTVGNPSGSAVLLEIVYYSQGLERITEQVVTLPALGSTVLDPGQSQGVANTAGLAVMTPIVSEADHTPIVPPRPLVGGFSIVNQTLGAGTGGNPFGRLALSQTGADLERRAEPGATVNGVNVRYQNIAPSTPFDGRSSLTFPVYFNPNTLSPPQLDGNRLFFASFADRYFATIGPGGAPRFNITPDPVDTTATFFSSSGGAPLLVTTLTVSGVRLETLQGLAGDVQFTSGGRLDISYPLPGLTSSDNFFGMASQSLGTFAIGQRLVPTDF